MRFRHYNDMRFPKRTRVVIGENRVSLENLFHRSLAAENLVAVEVIHKTLRQKHDRQSSCPVRISQ